MIAIYFLWGAIALFAWYNVCRKSADTLLLHIANKRGGEAFKSGQQVDSIMLRIILFYGLSAIGFIALSIVIHSLWLNFFQIMSIIFITTALSRIGNRHLQELKYSLDKPPAGLDLNKITAKLRDVFEASPYKKALEEAGFAFQQLNVEANGYSLLASVKTHCICGRDNLEAVRFPIRELSAESDDFQGFIHLDVVKILYQHKRFGSEHLIEDGFEPELAHKIEDDVEKSVQRLLAA